MQEKFDAVIVGAGMAGLVAAQHLSEAGLSVRVIEKGKQPGGRVRTDEVDGFRLDRGFQVLLTAYPEAQRYFDYKKLDLRNFDSGALIFHGRQNQKFYNPQRHREKFVETLRNDVASLRDLTILMRLASKWKRTPISTLFNQDQITTRKFLDKQGFSSKFVDRFLEPFMTGIFLESKLETPQRMFEFVMKMFSEAPAAIPAKGMGALSEQLVSGLPEGTIVYGEEVRNIRSGSVKTRSGKIFEAPIIIMATDPTNMLRNFVEEHQPYRTVANFYFSADKAPYTEPLIGLNYGGSRWVNNMAVLTNLSKDLAPEGKHLISVSVVRDLDRGEKDLQKIIKSELAQSFGSEVLEWQLIRSYFINRALPSPSVFDIELDDQDVVYQKGVYLAGDYLLNGSLNAALYSGRRAAEVALKDRAKSTSSSDLPSSSE